MSNTVIKIIQVVTAAKVISEKCFPKVGKHVQTSVNLTAFRLTVLQAVVLWITENTFHNMSLSH